MRSHSALPGSLLLADAKAAAAPGRRAFIRPHRFTTMSAFLFRAAAIIFLIGLISEQITSLTYNRPGRE